MVRKRKPGRPKGTKKVDNGVIDASQLFFYVPKDTLPTKHVDRFLKLCNQMIKSLGAETLNPTDVEEIAVYYRDRIYMDQIYETFALAQATDPTLVGQLEKLNKNLEQKKSNLGARFIDRGQKRKSKEGMTFIDLFENFVENEVEMEALAQSKKESIKTNKKSYTNPVDYIDSHTKSPTAGNTDDTDQSQ